MNSSKTLLIIGGGIIGMTIAREASLRGYFHKIIIIEKEKSLAFTPLQEIVVLYMRDFIMHLIHLKLFFALKLIIY